MRPISDIIRQEAPFEVISEYSPSGDQPQAIAELAERINNGESDIVLLGATGTGKSATTAWLIEQIQAPTLILEPNKTLAAQMAAQNFVSCYRTMRSNTSSPTMTTTSQRPMCPSRIPSSKRIPRLMTRWRGCVTPPRTRC